MAVHWNRARPGQGFIIACGVGERWSSQDITSTRDTQKVTCESCKKGIERRGLPRSSTRDATLSVIKADLEDWVLDRKNKDGYSNPDYCIRSGAHLPSGGS